MPEEERWILLGDPGTGKTTLLLYTAAQLARGALNDPTASIPIWVTLAPFGQQLERVPGYSLYEHIDSVGRSLLLSEFGREVQRVARKGKVIFLLDGLDEVLDHVREHLEDAIEVVLAIGTGNRVVITSRKVGFSGFLGYPLLEIAPLSLDDQRRIMLAICGKQKTQRLLAEISGRQELQDMASVPMMLTVLALVAREADHFSVDFFRRHSDLFRLASRILLEGRHRNRRGVAHPYHAELVLAHTSLVLHGNMDRARGDEVFDANDVEQAVATADQNWLTPWQGPRHFVEDVATTSNIIYPIDTLAQRYRYLHRTFREFLVALELSRWDSGRRREFVESVLDKQSYAEILVLLGGLVPDVDDYLTFLLSGPPDLALRSLKEVDSLDPKLAARVLQLRPMRLQARKQVFVELVRKLPSTDHLVDVLWAYLESAKETIPRVDLYFIQETLRNCNTPLADDLLGEMFKYLPSVPRDLFDYTDVMGEKLPYWSSVPEGKCVIGAAADDPEKPDWVATATEVYISSFDIGCVPVTNRVYEIFDPAHRRIRDFQDRVPPEDLDHHPVVRISWYEAEMFCHWAAQIFADVRLPTEFEWEKAASWTGERKLRFPWGDDWDPTFLNSWERGPNMTTRVGAYPQGVSPCGALDMAGNVWEWCLDWFRDDVEAYFTSLQSNPQDPIGPPSGVRRVDRGGGWYHDVGVPCTFLRAADDPADIFSHCGFRVVRSPVTQGRGSDLFGGQSTLKRIQIQEDEPTGVLEKIMALLSEHQKPES
jgi:formylglycine-generating enzyme required for sulfatase activity